MVTFAIRPLAMRPIPKVQSRFLMALGLAIGFAAAAHTVAGAQPPPQAPPAKPPSTTGQGAQPTGSDQPQRQPVFRAGANFVRVDVYATRNDAAVQDMRKDEFEVLEDGVPQIVDTFEHVVIRSGGPAADRVEPRSPREGNLMAADPRSRVFVLFLDTWHVTKASDRYIEGPLLRLLDRVIGPDDLVAVMTPLMSASEITFTRRTDTIGNLLLKNPWWGERGYLIKTDPTEQLYEHCFGREGAEPLIDRRRESMTLEALSDTVVHLEGIREERKAILAITEGWLLFRPDPALMNASDRPAPTGIFVGPDGRPTRTDPRNPGAGIAAQCEQDRVALSMLDDERRFRSLLGEANRANASFYPINPKGLTVFDSPMGPAPPPPLTVDMDRAKSRVDSLLTLADNTDGLAVVNTNDLDTGIRRVVSDLTSYYLIGYSSTNGKLDGRYRTIKVRSKRPGVNIRARRGYQAPTEAEVAARALAASAGPAAAESAPLAREVGRLESIRADALFRLAVAPGWWKPAGVPTAKAGRAEPALWVVGEIDTRRPGEDWSKGASAEVVLTRESGEQVATFTVAVPAGTGRFLTRFPRTSGDVWLDPGQYAMKVRIRPEAGGLPITDTIRFALDPPPAVDRPAIGQPVYLRKGSGASATPQATADLRYHRSETLVVDFSVSDPFTELSGALLGKTGSPLAVPVAVNFREEDGVRWIRAEVALSPLSAGDYLVRVSARTNERQELVMAPFRIIP